MATSLLLLFCLSPKKTTVKNSAFETNPLDGGKLSDARTGTHTHVLHHWFTNQKKVWILWSTWIQECVRYFTQPSSYNASGQQLHVQTIKYCIQEVITLFINPLINIAVNLLLNSATRITEMKALDKGGSFKPHVPHYFSLFGEHRVTTWKIKLSQKSLSAIVLHIV